MPGTDHANELVTWGAIALAVVAAAIPLAGVLVRASLVANAKRFDELMGAVRGLGDKFEHALERVRNHDTELAVRKKSEDDLIARVIYLEGEMRLVRDRHHGLASSIQHILLRVGVPLHLRDADPEGKP